MEPKASKTVPATTKKTGRPVQAEKKNIEVTVDSEWVTIRLPKKGLLHKLLSDLI
ncbi:MAG: hypothetical protein H7318_12825 [Oligoflexus sp.]|nr:hypothetical protein [Oligoflexus sp.]